MPVSETASDLIAARARAAMKLVAVCERLGYELDVAGTSGVYVVTRRAGTAVHVTAGPAADVLRSGRGRGGVSEDAWAARRELGQALRAARIAAGFQQAVVARRDLAATHAE